jgi:hypothetical protein
MAGGDGAVVALRGCLFGVVCLLSRAAGSHGAFGIKGFDFFVG